jgi:2-polyprenyl-6-hydroxyphenyl methylase / 3-demethylubiquinone-9 3-methyltransferase
VIYKDQKKAAVKKGSANATTIDEGEISRFNRLAEEWWKPKGAFKVVHAFNAARIEKLSIDLPSMMGRGNRVHQPLAGLTLLDVGCGAGIVSEPISRLGAKITAIDASERNILVAKQHAEKSGVDINYQNLLPEDIASTGETFDIVMSLEVIEHVANPDVFLNILASLVKPEGVLIIGTINRTAISFIKAIIGAEYIMGWLPKGTHNWRKFVRPEELDRILLPAGLTIESSCGVDFNPFQQKWRITKNPNSIYLRFYKRSATSDK